MTTTTTSTGRGDDFTATTTCTCTWSHTETLADDGSMMAAWERAEAAGDAHAAEHAAALTALAAELAR